MISLNKYFDRINYKGSADISYKTLVAIHTAHAFNIPFENLAIHDLSSDPENPIKLDEDSLQTKLIEQRRGGYCHETNELLAFALIQLGFKVDRLVAHVLGDNGIHELLLVEIANEKYLADAGFGGNGLIEPLPLKTDTSFNQFSECFKLTLEYPRSEKIQEYVLNVLIRDKWTPMYSFTLNPCLAGDFEPFNYYTSHKKTSVFTTNRICTKPTPSGRIILHNYKLKIRQDGHQESSLIKEEEYIDTLDSYFGIKLPASTVFKPLPNEPV